MLENIRLAFMEGIWGHKLRSVLTMLGIIIGIAAMIAIVSTIQGSNEQIKKNLIGSGTNAVNVQLTESGDTSSSYLEDGYNSIPDGVPVLSSSTRDELAQLDHVEDASLYVSRNSMEGNVFYNSTQVTCSLTGADIHFLNATGRTVLSGRTFLESDYTDYRKVAIIDKSLSDSIFTNENPIGKTLDIKGEPFTIIGVMEEKNNTELVINSVEDYQTYVEGNSQSGMVLIPDVDWGIVIQYDEPQNVYLLADSTDNMSSVGKEARELLNENVKNKDKIEYRAEDLQKQAENQQSLDRSINNLMIAIAAISLLVGGIGVMNIMLVSVTERTREIGLKKAIGARKRKIMEQFLTEAVVLTSLGGVIGTIAGIAVAEIIARVMNVAVAISVPSIVIAILFSMAIGLFFGLLPAYQASNLDPIIALRHE